MMDIWKHGTYVDTWSLVHFLSGFALAGFFYMYGASLFFAALVSTIVLLLWEVFEWLVKIIEPSINVAVDLLVGGCGFAVGSFLFFYKHFSVEMWLYPAIIVAAMLSLWGFIDFYRKGYR